MQSRATHNSALDTHQLVYSSHTLGEHVTRSLPDIPGVLTEILQPSAQWSDAIRFQEMLCHLASLFAANFQMYDLILPRIAQWPHSARHNWGVNMLGPSCAHLATCLLTIMRAPSADTLCETALLILPWHSRSTTQGHCCCMNDAYLNTAGSPLQLLI
jgi:hypothetical protein